MQKRIAKENWEFNFDVNRKKYSLKDKVLMRIEQYTGWRIGEYKNYKIT